VIEDAPAGIRAAHAAGIRVISLPSTYAVEDLAEADYLVAGLAQIRVNTNPSDPKAPVLIELD
jgi:sugar-phosphatase